MSRMTRRGFPGGASAGAAGAVLGRSVLRGAEPAGVKVASSADRPRIALVGWRF